MSSGRVILNEPRNDLANGVRKLSTTTASRATCFHSEREREKWYAEHIRSADPRGIEQNGPGCGRCRAAIVSGLFPVAGLFFAAGGVGIQRSGRAARRDRRRPPLFARVALAGRPGTHWRAASPVASRRDSRSIDFVAPPVRANDGRTLVFMSRRWWQLEPWMPGRADFWSRPSDSRLTAAVTSLARLHLAMASFEPAGAERTWFVSGNHDLAPAVLERTARLEGWSDDKLASLWIKLERSTQAGAGFHAAATTIVAGFHRCARGIAEELDAAQRFRVPLQPCFRDVWHDHILFVEDAVSGVIDPAAARTDTVAADISRLVGSLVRDDVRALGRGVGRVPGGASPVSRRGDPCRRSRSQRHAFVGHDMAGPPILLERRFRTSRAHRRADGANRAASRSIDRTPTSNSMTGGFKTTTALRHESAGCDAAP